MGDDASLVPEIFQRGGKKRLSKSSRHTVCQAESKGSRSQARSGRASVWKQRSKGNLRFWLPHCCGGRTERRGELRGHRRLRSFLFCGLAYISAAQVAWPSTQLITSEFPPEIVPPFLTTSRTRIWLLRAETRVLKPGVSASLTLKPKPRVLPNHLH